MTAPQRIQRRRAKGWRMPDGAVYVGRPSKWGNPFRFGTYTGLARVPAIDGSPWEYEGRISADGNRHDYHHPDGTVTVHHVRYMTRAECVEMYRRLLTEDLTPSMRSSGFRLGGLPTRPTARPVTVGEVRLNLVGVDLACWCPLNEPCHADVLLQIANAPGERR